MTNIVEFVIATPERQIVGQGPGYPQKPADEVLRREMVELRALRTALADATYEPDFEALERRAAPLCGNAGADLLAAIQHDLRPATIDNIRGQIALLMECRREFKANEEKEVFWVQMTERVCALQPSVGALRYAFKRLINEPRPQFKPRTEISDVLEMVKEEQYLRERAVDLMIQIPRSIAERRAKIDKGVADQQQRRERQKAFIREHLTRPPSEDPLASVSDLSDFDKVLVEEVRQELGLAP